MEWYIKCLCFSLPMRDGNPTPEGWKPEALGKDRDFQYGFSLPMRDGNRKKSWSGT